MGPGPLIGKEFRCLSPIMLHPILYAYLWKRGIETVWQKNVHLRHTTTSWTFQYSFTCIDFETDSELQQKRRQCFVWGNYQWQQQRQQHNPRRCIVVWVAVNGSCTHFVRQTTITRLLLLLIVSAVAQCEWALNPFLCFNVIMTSQTFCLKVVHFHSWAHLTLQLTPVLKYSNVGNYDK